MENHPLRTLCAEAEMSEQPAELPELLSMWNEVDRIMTALEREKYIKAEMADQGASDER